MLMTREVYRQKFGGVLNCLSYIEYRLDVYIVCIV